MTQQYVAAVIDGVSEAGDCWTSLALADGRPAGLIRLPLASAKSWAARALGGSSADQADRDLSAVEGELVLDIVSAMVEGLSAASELAGGPAFEHSGRLDRGQPELAGRGTDDYCSFSFGAEGSDDAGNVSVVILSEAMDTVARGGAVDKAAKSPEAVREDLVAHLEQLIVVATVCLGRAEVAIRDVFALEPGDVLVTETMVGEPIELLVTGQVVLSGMPVQSSGRYALKITAADGDAAGAATKPPG